MNGTQEDFVASEGCIPTDSLEEHPFYDEFWRAKAAKLDEITVPMLVCASFSDHGLHTMGSFRAFIQAKSPHKWVYTHRTGKWDAYYSSEVQDLTRNFMDCFLKGDSASGFLATPSVRLEVRSSRDEIRDVRYENEWPIAPTEYTRLYLSEQQSLALEKPQAVRESTYSAKKGKVKFQYTFSKDTELSGYMKLRVWVESRPRKAGDATPDDMALFVAVNKLDREGQSVHFYGSVGSRRDMVTRGYCRVSRRELDPNESTEWNPVQSGARELKLEAGEIVVVDIALYPSSTFFAAGEAVQLIVASREIIPSPPYIKDASLNRGTHVLHFGGEYDSHLLVPKV
jgi:putative CocE/NonD family hydrolase